MKEEVMADSKVLSQHSPKEIENPPPLLKKRNPIHESQPLNYELNLRPPICMNSNYSTVILGIMPNVNFCHAFIITIMSLDASQVSTFSL